MGYNLRSSEAGHYTKHTVTRVQVGGEITKVDVDMPVMKGAAFAAREYDITSTSQPVDPNLALANAAAFLAVNQPRLPVHDTKGPNGMASAKNVLPKNPGIVLN